LTPEPPPSTPEPPPSTPEPPPSTPVTPGGPDPSFLSQAGHSAIILSFPEVSFGEVFVGDEAQMLVSILNKGSADLVLESVLVSNDLFELSLPQSEDEPVEFIFDRPSRLENWSGIDQIDYEIKPNYRGRRELYVTGTEGSRSILTAPCSFDGDYELTLATNWHSGNRQAAYGILIRESKSGCYSIAINAEGQYVLGKWESGQHSVISEPTRSSGIISAFTNEIRVVTSGSKMALYVNDKETIVIYDSDFQGDGLSLFVAEDQVVSFSKLEIKPTLAQTFPITVQPDAQFDLDLRISPTRAGEVAGSVNIKTNDPENGDLEIPLHLSAVVSADFDSDGIVGFTDFLHFSEHFGRNQGDMTFDAMFDFDSDGMIGFSDFLIFVESFGTAE
jgi:hypothetical protein